jgi:preprotein translocase subunit SecG
MPSNPIELMNLFPIAAFQLSQYIFGPLLFLLSTFIILIILLQRGRGGGLTGALGGAGGSSAFGVKAGDIFTRITAISVLCWIVLCAFVCWFYLPEKLDIEVDPGVTTTSGAGSMSIGPGAKDSGKQDGENATPLPPASAVLPGAESTPSGSGNTIVPPASADTKPANAPEATNPPAPSTSSNSSSAEPTPPKSEGTPSDKP